MASKRVLEEVENFKKVMEAPKQVSMAEAPKASVHGEQVFKEESRIISKAQCLMVPANFD